MRQRGCFQNDIFTGQQAAEQVKVHLHPSLSSRRSASADQPTQSLSEVGEHLLHICHTVDSDAGQVGNCGEEKLADVFLVISDRSDHNGG